MIAGLIPDFVNIRFLDIIDILLVAFLLYHLYILIRGTGAMYIFLGILAIYLVWMVVRAFEMELLSEILGQFISVGVLALIIVFQPEIRKFLLMIGTRSVINKGSKSIFRKLWQFDEQASLNIAPIVNACETFADNKTGALIVITKENNLEYYLETGEIINANVSGSLIESIFYKDNPLHDGALIITNNKIAAARCVLPVSENPKFPANLGLRHRAALGISEHSDAVAIVVSEQSGRISWCKDGEMKGHLKPVQLKEYLAKEFVVR